MQSVSCPECGGPVEIPQDAAVGELIVCPTCGVELELVSKDPVGVELFEEEEK